MGKSEDSDILLQHCGTLYIYMYIYILQILSVEVSGTVAFNKNPRPTRPLSFQGAGLKEWAWILLAAPSLEP